MTIHHYLLPSAERQAAAMLGVLQARRPGASVQLRRNALHSLAQWTGELRVRLVDEITGADRGCSVYGGYRHDTDPPSIVVAATASVRRRQFTALHELGHHLQKSDLALGEYLLESPQSKVLEDLSCDAFAARVLLPDDMTDLCLGQGTPTSDAVAALYRASGASRAASCVRAATRMVGSGAVILYDSRGHVSFAASRGDVFAPPQGSDQSRTELVRAALDQQSRDGSHPVVRSTSIVYRQGYARSPLYGHATWCDGFILAVLVEHDAPWRRMSPPRSTLGHPTREYEHECAVCDDRSPVSMRCPRCHEPVCPGGHCECTQNAERLCPRCFLLRHPRLFVKEGGACRECRE